MTLLTPIGTATHSNTVDVFPDDSTEWVDYDGDGTGDNADTDDDADGTLDVNDAFQFDVCADTDTEVMASQTA